MYIYNFAGGGGKVDRESSYKGYVLGVVVVVGGYLWQFNFYKINAGICLCTLLYKGKIDFNVHLMYSSDTLYVH